MKQNFLSSINSSFLSKKHSMTLDVFCKSSIIFLGAIVLNGCAVPGFDIAKIPSEDGGLRTHILGYRPVLEAEPVDDGFGAQGTLLSISPQLVREQKVKKNQGIPLEVKALFGVPDTYTIGPGDVIGITVYDHPELLPNAGAVIAQSSDPTGISVAPGFIVGSTGEVSFPYVGKVRVEGLTEIGASDLITQRIATYIRDPQVTVRIISFRSRRAFVEGEVKTPGLQIFTDVPMTLAEALSRAGGITSAGDSSFVTLTRKEETTIIDLPYLQASGANGKNIPLKNGDLINVRNREDRKVYVMGEVVRPAALLMNNGKLSLNDAMAQSGGPNLATANPGQIYVIRNSSNSTPEIYHLNAKNPLALALAEQFELKPRDVVYIDPVPLVQWNRIISLILPAATVANYGSQVMTR